MKANPNPRITIESLEASETVPFIGLHKSDFKLLIVPALAVLVIGILGGYPIIGGVGAAVMFGIAMLIIYVTPSYMTSKQYLKTLREYVERPTRFSYTTDTEIDPESYFDRFEEEKSTTELTHVKRYYKRGVVERKDGKFLAALRLEPHSMDFATAEEWAEVTKTCESYANNSADYDCHFYITSREFPVDSYTKNLEERLDDEDIQSLPMLRATLKELIKERPNQMEKADLAPLHFYALVSVDKNEIITNTTADTSALEKLSKIPVLGIPFSTFATLREDLDELHTKTRMMRKLDERISSIENGLVRDIDGFGCSRVSTVEWVLNIEDFWKAYDPNFDDYEGVADSAPIVGRGEVQKIREAIQEEHSELADEEGGEAESDTDTSEEESEDDIEQAVSNSGFEFEFEPADVKPPEASDSEDGSEREDSATSSDDDTESEDETSEEELSGLSGKLVKLLVGEGDEALSGDDTAGDDATSTSDEDSETPISAGDSEGSMTTEGDDEASSSDTAEKTGILGGLFGVGDSTDTVAEGSADESEISTPDPGSAGEQEMFDVELPEKEDLHQISLSAEDIEKKYRSVVVDGTEHRQVLFVESWPKNLKVGALRELFTRSDLKIDLSIHSKPRDREEALSKSERRIQSLETDASAGLGGFAAQDRLEQAEEVEICRDHLDGGQQPFDVSIFVTVRAESEEELRDNVRTVRDIFRDAPANMGLKTLSGNQIRGLQACSPIAKDVVNEDCEFSTDQLLLGQGLACLLSSFKQSTLLEEGGIEFGEHAFNGTPIIKDPFESETNYNWVVIGDSGSGKSYQSKEMALRTMMGRENTKLIILDPLEGFFGLSKALDAEHITIGGNRGLNPLEIRPPADHSGTAEDIDPLSQKIKDVMSFFENFATQQGLDLGAKRPILSAALKAAYKQKGITHDIETHSRESPTIADVLDCLKDMAENPENYVVKTITETESIRQNATQLIGHLRPFVEGAYQNLAKHSEFDLRGEDVVYLDLSQQEHTASGGGIMMQLMFSLVYERAKETPKDVIFLIDEARFLMRDAQNLEFLGQRVRHSRHYNTSIRFITQNIGDFFSHEEAESIINNSFINIFHQTEEIAQWADTFGMNEQEVRFVQNAQTGQNGYSEALVSINNTRYPIQFFSTDSEDAIIDFDPRTQTQDALPGTDEEISDLAKEIRGTLEELYGDVADDLVDRQDELDALYDELPPTHKRYLSLLDEFEFYQAMDMIQSESDPSGIIAAAVSEKMGEMFGEINQEALTERLRAAELQYNEESMAQNQRESRDSNQPSDDPVATREAEPSENQDSAKREDAQAPSPSTDD